MVVEDEVNIRLELRMILEHALYEVVLVEEFLDVAKQILEVKPDVVLLDLNLPHESGLMICTQVRACSDVPIIFVTSCNTSMDELNCITMGGDDYISKPYNAPILLARIASLLKRTQKATPVEEKVLTHRNLTLDVLAAKVKYDGQEVELSKNELKILYYLFQHIDQFVPRMDLVEYLWDNQIFIDDNTLSVNVTRIRSKLQSVGMVDFIETKRGLGYKI